MINQNRELVEKHIKTHTERSNDDVNAVSVLQTFLRCNGKINTNFSYNDKWPNTDGTFEFVHNPDISRRPEQNFIVQIKGTKNYVENDGVVKYSLKSLAFPAYICLNVSLDPGIIFVVLNPNCRGKERVFWKYMSVNFLNSINFEHDSVTISFYPEEEILNTEEGVEKFCEQLEKIIAFHSFVNKLDSRNYSKEEIVKIIKDCDEFITENLERFERLNDTRDNVSKRILTRLYDLCTSTLLLSAIKSGIKNASLQLAWENSLLDIKTKYLGNFLRGLEYIGRRIPEEGQSERLMLKYYNFLWQIREYLQEEFDIKVLQDLEKFPHHLDELDEQFYGLVAEAVDSVELSKTRSYTTRFYVQKKIPFFIGNKRYFEITLQLASKFASKFNRITVYTKENISTNYSIQISYVDTTVAMWSIQSKIKVVTDWRVSVDAACLNKLGKILGFKINISSKYGEYIKLMNFLTQTGLNFLDLIDFQELQFSNIIETIYNDANTYLFKEVLVYLKEHFSKKSNEKGRNVIRYLLLGMREETLEDVMPTVYNPKKLCEGLYLSSSCYPFEKNPLISNLVNKKTSENSMRALLDVAGIQNLNTLSPYLKLKNEIKLSGEIYFDDTFLEKEAIDRYNDGLDKWEKSNGYMINAENGYISIEGYEKTTLAILSKMLEFASKENKGQKEYNKSFLQKYRGEFEDKIKERALQNVFVKSRLLLIYGAAGTGKTTLMNYISNLMSGRSKLFLTKTHTALQNLKRRIENPGASSNFISLDSFTRKVNLTEYDVIFIDECSIIDNRSMWQFLQKIRPDTFLVLAGDIYQIESIDFSNWFFYAKDIIKTEGSNVELLNTWRTKDQSLIGLWDEVRRKDILIVEKLAMDGPYSENIGSNIFDKKEKDEVVLCLNYDGKFGLNNMNNYFQYDNSKGELISWKEWNYKVGDPILFIETKRFSLLYNNLKGKIFEIQKRKNEISFTIDVYIVLTEMDCQKEGIEFVDAGEGYTRIRFSVYDYDDSLADEEMRMQTVVPFQLAYAVSIHKAQGLEYDSVKIIIPSSNAEKITHGVFYTAITRAKKKLKIYWSSETMEAIVAGMTTDGVKSNSLEIVKSKLFSENNYLN